VSVNHDGVLWRDLDDVLSLVVPARRGRGLFSRADRLNAACCNSSNVDELNT